MTWSHRDRVLAALNHEETDRVPIDFAGTSATTLTIPTYEKLKRHLGVETETAVMIKNALLAFPDESILRRFDVDTRYLSFGASFGERETQIDEYNVRDEWGTIWRKPPGEHPAMPVDGPFYGKEPDIADLENWAWIDPDDPAYYDGLAERARALRQKTDFAIVLNPPVGPVHQGQFMRGFADWLKDLYKHTEYVGRMTEIIADLWIRIVENALDAVGKNVDAIYWGDDLASQNGPLFSPQAYRELIKPHHRRMIAALKANTDAKCIYHSCGSAYPFLEDLIEIGIDVLNPVQVLAKNMEPERLKAEFGDRVAFWGGIDIQKLLPFGSAEEVAAETDRIIGILAKGGGYVLAGAHDIQAEVPPENIVAMLETARAHPLGGTA